MAPHILMIQRTTLPWSDHAYGSIKSQLIHDEVMPAELLAWFCQCPLDAITAWRVGPIWIAHGGEWAERHELESFRWPHLGGSVIHGKAIGVMPDQHMGGWRALTEGEADRALVVLWRFMGGLTQSSAPADHSFTVTLSHHQLVAYRAADEAGKLEFRRKVARERRELRVAMGLAA